MKRDQEREQARSREQAHGRCLNYALGYLDALAGNAFGEDARTSAQQAAQAIRDANEHIAARRAAPPDFEEWYSRASERANETAANET